MKPETESTKKAIVPKSIHLLYVIFWVTGRLLFVHVQEINDRCAEGSNRLERPGAQNANASCIIWEVVYEAFD